MGDEAQGAVRPSAPPRRSFLSGALVLVVGSLGSRVLGIAYRLVLPILMGGGRQAAVGMGLFQLAYPIFTVIVTLITTGIPFALSKLVAEQLARGDDRAARRLFLAGRTVLPLVGLVLTVVLWELAPVVAHYVARDARVTLTVRAIAPALFTISLASAYRGAFQGMEDMLPHAVSQIAEQICRVLTMFGLVLLLLPRGIQWAAAGASFGATVGGVAASVAMLWLWPRRAGRLAARWGGSAARRTRRVGRRPAPRDLLRAVGKILALAVPIAAGAMLLPLLNLADAVIVPLRLRAIGLGPESIALYGVLTGYAAPLVLMPTLFTAALAASLLPAVSAALSAGDRTRGGSVAASGLRLAVMLILPAAAGLMLLAGPLPQLLFHSAAATAPLRLMAPAVLFLSLQQTSTGVLQGLGRPELPLWHLAVGGLVKVLLDWVLVADPALNVGGAALATTVAFAVASALNLRAVAARLPSVLDWSGLVLRPLAATGVMSVVVWAAGRGALGRHPALEVGVAILAGGAAYLAALLAFGGVRRRDLEALPRIGARLAGTLIRYGLIRA